MTDFRALCAELLEALENAIRVIYHEDGTKHISTADAVIAKADAALAQPEPQGPDLTACDLLERFIDCFWDEQDAESYPNAAALVAQARALLAQPEPQGPTDEEIDDWHGRCADLTRLGEADHYWAFDLRHDEVADVVRAALARWGTPATTGEQQ